MKKVFFLAGYFWQWVTLPLEVSSLRREMGFVFLLLSHCPFCKEKLGKGTADGMESVPSGSDLYNNP